VVLRSVQAYWTWLAPAAVTVLVFLSRRRALVAAWLVFVAAAAPVLGLVPFDFQAVSTVADHYVYLSMLGAALAVAWLVAHAGRRVIVARVAAVAVIIVLGVLSVLQAGHWRDSRGVWSRAMEVNPRSELAYGNLGVLELESGNVAGALPLLERAAQLNPNDPFAPMSLSRAQLAAGDAAGAADSALDMVDAFRRRSDFDPTLAAEWLEAVATAAARQGDAATAEKLRAEARRLRQH
jgi:tetratricopeptide (TPR) repeat protein